MLYNIIGFSAILSAIIAGYEVTQRNDGTIPYWTIILGVFAIIAAVSNAGVKFFGFENRRDSHRKSASDYATLQHDMDLLLMDSNNIIQQEKYKDISLRLSEIDKRSPLLSPKVKSLAKNLVQNQNYKTIPETYIYDVELNEKWKIHNGNPPEDISNNPIREYICESLEYEEFDISKIIRIYNRHIMKRNGNEWRSIIEGEGIKADNIGYIRYSHRESETGNTTYGTMILNFTNKIHVKGYWMVANVKGADFLIGTIEMNLKCNELQINNG